MAEYTAILPQDVALGANVLLTETPVYGNNCIIHREGSGVITLRGNTNQNRALYRISYGANIAVATGGTLGPISVSLAVDGEPLPSTTAVVTPAAIGDFFNVHGDVFICVPRGCCVTAALRNTSATATAITVSNLNIIAECAA